jgi:hypothetical protein
MMDDHGKVKGFTRLEGYPSGQRGQTVNLLAHAFVGSNPTPSMPGRVVDGGAMGPSGGREAGVVQW